MRASFGGAKPFAIEVGQSSRLVQFEQCKVYTFPQGTAFGQGDAIVLLLEHWTNQSYWASLGGIDFVREYRRIENHRLRAGGFDCSEGIFECLAFDDASIDGTQVVHDRGASDSRNSSPGQAVRPSNGARDRLGGHLG